MEKKYTPEILIKKLKAEKQHLKRVPTARDMNVASKAGRAPAVGVYQYYFHSYNRALIIAELRMNRASKYKKEKLLADLKRLYEILKHLPTTKELSEFNEKGLMAERTVYLDTFETMKKAYEAAGIDLTKEKDKWVQKRKAQLITQLQNLSQEEKKNLSGSKATFLHKQGKIANLSTFVEVFGTWVKALETAGIRPRRKIYSDEGLISILKSEYQFTKQAPTCNYFTEMSKLGLLPCPNTYCYHFGSWNKALIIAGIDAT